ncbi:MAG TPA: hypothetical protein VKH44_08315, partial [Pirellulaceae bacterium]|nr:hypothetical protein [Pirellulaceae bacterium]
MAEIRRTTIPQFTIRGLLLATTVMAVVSFAFSQALRGTAWVGGVSIGLAALVLSFAVYVLMFAFIAFIARFFGRNRPDSRGRKESSPIRTSLFILVALNAFALCDRTVHASSGGVLVLPRLAPGEVDKTGGLMLTIDMNWIDSCGYRPIRVELKSVSGPVTADRVLTLRFRPKQAYTRFDSVAATQVLEIPTGSSSVTATLSVPQLCPW